MVLFRPLLDPVVPDLLLVVVTLLAAVVLPAVADLQVAADLQAVVLPLAVAVLLLQAHLLSTLMRPHVVLDPLQPPWSDSIGVNIVLIHVTSMLL